jgi:ankyrin repeat protein
VKGPRSDPVDPDRVAWDHQVQGGSATLGKSYDLDLKPMHLRTTALVTPLLLNRAKSRIQRSIDSAMSLHDPSRWAPADYVYRQFFAAVKSGVADDVKLCLRRQDINVNLLNGKHKDFFGETALHMAAARDNVEMIELLLAEGARVDELDSNTDGGSTPLHKAAWAAHVASIQALIDAGADVNAWSATNGTPLHEVLWSMSAVRPEHREAINVLVRNGADLFAEHESTGETVARASFP